MHPMVLESLTQQRLQDLRSGISQRPHSQSYGNPSLARPGLFGGIR